MQLAEVLLRLQRGDEAHALLREVIAIEEHMAIDGQPRRVSLAKAKALLGEG